MTAPTHTASSERALFSGPEIKSDKLNGTWNKTEREEHNTGRVTGLVLFPLKLRESNQAVWWK